MAEAGQRRWYIVRGSADETTLRVHAALAAVTGEIIWVSATAPLSPVAERVTLVEPRALGGQLGRSAAVVVLDHHGGFDAEVLGRAHGLVRGGGALISRLPPSGTEPDPAGLAHLCAHPYGPADVGRRFAGLVEAALARWGRALPERVVVEPWTTQGSDEQRALVVALAASWRGAASSRSVLTADRGRGKSSALGLTLGEAGIDDAIVTAAGEEAVAELLAFASGRARFVPLLALVAAGAPTAAVLIVDEAAQLPVHLLQALVRRHPRAHLAFATTVHGYEGTGRGFALRLTPWLRGQDPAPMERTLNEAIRWSADDDLERAIFSTLLLDAEPAAGPFSESDSARARMLTLDRDALVADPARLRALFGLLVQAHYRTTPGDLQRMLDAPNLEVHAAELDGEIVAVNLVAAEGELAPTMAVDAAAGRTRLRAQALADVLVAHLGRVEAGSLSMRRSVRIAVHPQLRRTGLARRLIAFVHERHPEVDLFGTLFAATAEIIALRRRLGYEVVRVSASRGARSGEPSVMMLRPQSRSAHALVAALRVELTRELDTQLELLRADEGIALAPALEEALRLGLGPALPLTTAEVLAAVRAYAEGPRTFESMATALRAFAAQADLRALDEPARAVVRGRVLAGRSWASVAADAGLSQPAAMRALRRAIRDLLSSTRGRPR